MIVRGLINEGQTKIESVSDSPLLDCQILLSHVLEKPRSWLISHDDENVGEKYIDCFRALISRRLNGEPVAYLTGTKGFWQRDFSVSPEVLIPRPETELLVETALARLEASEKYVIDLGTGSGAIAISLAAERPTWQLIGVDTSAAAVAVATSNGADLSNIDFRRGYWCEGIEPLSCDAIISNPPYVRDNDPHLKALQHEPIAALTSGPDGLDAIRTITAEAAHCIRPGGLLLIEHGFDQQIEVIELFRLAGFCKVEGLADLNNVPRAVVGYKP